MGSHVIVGQDLQGFRNSRPDAFCKEGVFRNFAKIHRKAPLPECLF